MTLTKQSGINLLFLLLTAPASSPARAAAGPAETPHPRQADLDALVKQLVGQIEKVRGLKFIKPVVAKILTRPKQAGPGIQGYYSLKEKKLFLYDDVKSSYWKGVLIHEMVHALQDQHFGLEKLHEPFLGSDEELARAALIEGDATLSMIEVLGPNSHAARMLSVPLEKSRNLENAFLYAQGTRYVQELKKRGGWSAVDFRYGNLPRTTAAILHPGERIIPLKLGPGKPVGELGLIRMLLSQPATAPRSVQAAAGWRGDRTIQQGKARGWVVAFARPEQAERFRNALLDLRQAEHPSWKKLEQQGAGVLVSPTGARRGVLRSGSRVLDLSAPNEKAYRELLDRIDGPPKLTIYSAKAKQRLTFGQLTDRLLEGEIICIGESHDSELDHQVQLMIIKALYARDERLGVGMEMFQRPFQKTLDRYLSGAVNEDTFLEDSEYQKRWGFPWRLYRPIVEFCKRNGIPLAALNVGDELRRKVSKVGYDKLSALEKKQLGPIDFQVKEHRRHWFEKLGKIPGHGPLSGESKERYYRVMTVWDEYMADSAARFQKERKLRRMVILAGSGHIEYGFGIPDRAAKRTGGKVLTVRILLGRAPENLAADPRADFVLIAE
jgi:uncharacterized iron-regulated protein